MCCVDEVEVGEGFSEASSGKHTLLFGLGQPATSIKRCKTHIKFFKGATRELDMRNPFRGFFRWTKVGLEPGPWVTEQCAITLGHA